MVWLILGVNWIKEYLETWEKCYFWVCLCLCFQRIVVYESTWTRWERSTPNLSEHHPICWEPMCWIWYTLFLSCALITTPGSLAFGLHDLYQRSPGFSGLWLWTKSYTLMILFLRPTDLDWIMAPVSQGLQLADDLSWEFPASIIM